MIYIWEGLKGNEFLSGNLEAETEEEAVFKLKKDGVIVTKISELDSKTKPKEKLKAKKKLFKQKIKDDEILLFTKKFATMISAGMAIVPSLKMLYEQSENPSMKDFLSDIIDKVNSGIPLSKALEVHSEYFDSVFINLVKAGEESGKLDNFLTKITLGLAKKIKIIRSMKKALMYPMILLAVALVVIGVMMIYVVPVFVEIFASGGVDLPTPTKIVMNISDFVRSYSMLLLIVILIVGFKMYQRIYKANEKFREQFDKKKLSMPLFGPLFTNMILSRFSAVLSDLVSGGVNLVQAMEIAKNAITNQFIQNKLEVVRRDIFSGKPFSTSLRSTEAFPETLSGFVEVGEETGKLNEMLMTISNFYEDEFDNAVENFSQLLEPIMIVFLGVVIGFILVAMYMPIFQMGSAVS